MKQEVFEQLKAELIAAAGAAGAYCDEYTRAKNASTETELLQVIKDNLIWCSKKAIIGEDFFARFTPEVYMASGIPNNGKENIGWANTGYSNTGSSNTGDSNTGYRNTGDSNTGYRNTGDWNTGSRNTGDSNTGDSNTGDWNTGDWNTGYSNTGYSNTGDRNTGAFCTTTNPKIEMFNKPSDWTTADFLNSKAYSIMCQGLIPNIWIDSDSMTDEEKAMYPQHTTTGGYLKSISLKEAWANMWPNLNADAQKAFTILPNFCPSIFEEITGIKISN